MRKKHFSNLLFFLAVFLLLTLLLAGCQKATDETTTGVTPQATAVSNVVVSTPAANPVPPAVVVKTTLRPAIDPACLEDQGKFALTTAPLPDEGLEPGMVHVFCATGAPAGETVSFTLRSPDGKELTFEAPSVDQGTVTVAVLPVTIGADAKPGKWTLTALSQGKKDAITFVVKSASQPFIVLAEPVPDDPGVIRVAVGGLPPDSNAYFAIYRLQPGQTAANIAEARGELLIDDLIQVDDSGRADVALDVADQPSGPYLLTLLPADGSQTASSVITLPDQGRMALAINIQRGGAAPGASGETGQGESQQPVAATLQNLPPAPKTAEAGGGLPDATTVSLPDAQLPPCTPTSTATVQLWPQSGEVGQWWYGCASGFSANKPLRVDATLGDGATSSFDLTETSADGVKSFRWYSLPEEGSGVVAITISDLVGNKADAQWTISQATRPHLLVYPHVIDKGVGAQISLVGFPKRASVQLGIYQLDSAGAATLVKKMTMKTDKRGVVQQQFTKVNDLIPGTYLVMAQSAPAYEFAGIGTPATAIEFFSVGVPLAEKYEFYTLFVGRKTGTQVVTGGEGENAASGEGSASGATSEPGIPSALAIPVDNSAQPTCPDAQAGSPAICMMPTTTQRATYVYMLMQGFEAGAKFTVKVTNPKGVAVTFSVNANDSGTADAHWYALNDERLGTYKVRIRGGGKTFNGAFKVVKATSPHVVVQTRSPQPGTPVIISISGLKPKTTYVLARYRSVGEAGGQVQFELVDATKMSTGKGGGAKATFATKSGDGGVLFLAALYEQNGSQPLAKEVYAPGQELYLRYPYAWGQAGQEGN